MQLLQEYAKQQKELKGYVFKSRAALSPSHGMAKSHTGDNTKNLSPSHVKCDSILRRQTPINIEREWKKAIKHARLDNFRFHDLRHTTASYLAMNGATPNDIAEVLGHKTLNMVKRYAHLCKTHTAKVVRDMCEGILIV